MVVDYDSETKNCFLASSVSPALVSEELISVRDISTAREGCRVIDPRMIGLSSLSDEMSSHEGERSDTCSWLSTLRDSPKGRTVIQASSLQRSVELELGQ